MIDLTNLTTIQSLLKKYNLSPNKFLGQNFLIDKNILDKIIESADLSTFGGSAVGGKSGGNVLEIGPGLGTLTEALCQKGANVIAIEKDKDLIPVLEENLKEFKNVKIVNDDFLAIDFNSIFAGFCHCEEPGKATRQSSMPLENTEIASLPVVARNDRKEDFLEFRYSVISNIPYYITSPVIRKILSAEHLPEQIVFLVQREVAERIAAKPGDMSFISVFVQFYGTPSVVEIVKSESFWPAPEVDSAILKIVLDRKRKISEEEKKELWRLVKIGFAARRKTLANNLSAGFHVPREKIEETIENLGFDKKARAQELGVDDWIKLFDKFSVADKKINSKGAV